MTTIKIRNTKENIKIPFMNIRKGMYFLKDGEIYIKVHGSIKMNAVRLIDGNTFIFDNSDEVIHVTQLDIQFGVSRF